VGLPVVPSFCSHNAHLFYIVCRNAAERDGLLGYLNHHGVNAIFHYLSLHKSTFYQSRHRGGELPQSDRYSENLVRLPLYYELSKEQLEYITDKVKEYFYDRPI
jgi:dTDP-4-amino-4,6-dideoxygalactose transaminase